MNEDFKPEYEASLQDYVNVRAKYDSLLQTAQTVHADNAAFVVTEAKNLRNLEEAARNRWESARDSYLSQG